MVFLEALELGALLGNLLSQNDSPIDLSGIAVRGLLFALCGSTIILDMVVEWGMRNSCEPVELDEEGGLFSMAALSDIVEGAENRGLGV